MTGKNPQYPNDTRPCGGRELKRLSDFASDPHQRSRGILRCESGTRQESYPSMTVRTPAASRMPYRNQVLQRFAVVLLSAVFSDRGGQPK